MKKVVAFLFVGALVGCGGGGSGGGSGTKTVNRQVLATGLNQPMQYILNPANSHLAYVIERPGVVRLLVDDVLQSTPVVDISSSVATEGEAGLLGMTLDPNFATNKAFYLYYVTGSPLHSHVGKYAMAGDMRTASSSESSVFDVAQPFDNHKGGSLHFGPDGFLYLMYGDGGSGNDPDNRAQDPQSLLGKILRIDPNGADAYPSDPLNNYAIPPSNPFVSTAGVLPEIWAFGMRNPFRWSFDSLTGAKVIADVGQDAFEEIDYEPANTPGRNYGWRVREGLHASGNAGPLFSDTLQDPFLEYNHTVGKSIIGGFICRGTGFAAGKYLFADYVTNRLWTVPIVLAGSEAQRTSLGAATELKVADGWNGPVSIDPDATGEVIVTELNSGQVSRLTTGS